MTAATLVSVMNGWRAGGMRRVHDFGVSCVIRGVSGALADSQIPEFRTEMQPLVGLGMRQIGFSGHTGSAPVKRRKRPLSADEVGRVTSEASLSKHRKGRGSRPIRR